MLIQSFVANVIIISSQMTLYVNVARQNTEPQGDGKTEIKQRSSVR
jgi:hypothetical protein